MSVLASLLILLLYALLRSNLIEGTTFWYNHNYYNDSSTGCDYDNDPANIPNCCSTSNKCGPIQGHCDDDSECLDGLSCQSGSYLSYGALKVCTPKDRAIIDYNTCVEYSANYGYNDIGGIFLNLPTKEACFELCLTYPTWECVGSLWYSPDISNHSPRGCYLKHKFLNRNSIGMTNHFTMHRNCSMISY